MLHLGVHICPYLQAQSYQTQDVPGVFVTHLFIPCFEETQKKKNSYRF